MTRRAPFAVHVITRVVITAAVIAFIHFGLGYVPVAVAILLWIVLALTVARRPQPPRPVTATPRR